MIDWFVLKARLIQPSVRRFSLESHLGQAPSYPTRFCSPRPFRRRIRQSVPNPSSASRGQRGSSNGFLGRLRVAWSRRLSLQLRETI